MRRGSISAIMQTLSLRLLLTLCGSAAMGIVAMVFVLLTANQFLQFSRTATEAERVLEAGLEARLNALKFRISGDTELSERFGENVSEIVNVSTALRAGGTLEDDIRSALQKAEQLITEYDAAFEKIVGFKAPRNAMVTDLASSGTEIRQALSEIMESAFIDGDPVASIYAGRAQEALLLGRLYMERFLLNNQVESYDRAQRAFAEAIAGLAELIPELQNPRRLELANSAKSQIGAFVATGEDIFNLIQDRNDARAQMDVIGPQFIEAVDFVMGKMAENQEIVGSRLRQVGWTMILVLALSTAFAVFFAHRTSGRTSTYVKTSIDKFVVAMTGLANGKTEIDLGRPPDPDTELGRMADALSVFRDNAIEKAELEKTQALQEQRQAAEKEAQRKRDEAAEKEAQDRIEEERLALLERLEKSVGIVVENAAKGDFSKRVTVDFDEASLRRMAEGINQLLQNVNDGLSATSKVLSSLSKGDLTKRVQGDFEGGFKDLQQNTNEMVSGLKTLIGEISGSSANLSSSSGELRETSDVLSKQAEQNAASLEETSAAIEQLTASIKKVSENVTDANGNARTARKTAQSSSAVAAAAANAMTEISEASTEIARVVTVINDIAFQINLLALNAGVEAARAGEAGRGFSVVASEVRQLSQRASDAAKEIDEVIGRSSVAVTEGVDRVNDAQSSLAKISESVVGVSNRIDEIAIAIDEQVGGVTEINNAVSQIDQNTQKQAASFEELAAASSVLSNEAKGLERSTARFDTGADRVSAAVKSDGQAEEKLEDSQARQTPLPVTGNLAVDPAGWEEF